MKKRSWAVLIALTALIVVMSACGSTAKYDNSSSAVSPETNWNGSADYGTGNSMDTIVEGEKDFATGDTATATTGRKLIKTVWLELESKQYPEALASLQKLVEEAGGYIESQSEQGQSYYGSYRSRYATITARIPAEKLDEVTEEAGGLCNLVNKSSDTSDITDSYTDVEARLKTLNLQEERLLEILSKATTLSDVIQLEQSLSDVRYEIERMTATLKNYDSQVSYSTLNITLNEVVDYNLVSSPPATLGQRLADAWQNALLIVKNGFSGFMVWLVTYLPSILIWVVILGAVAFAAVKLLRRRKAAKKQAIPASTAPAPEEKDGESHEK